MSKSYLNPIQVVFAIINCTIWACNPFDIEMFEVGTLFFFLNTILLHFPSIRFKEHIDVPPLNCRAIYTILSITVTRPITSLAYLICPITIFILQFHQYNLMTTTSHACEQARCLYFHGKEGLENTIQS